MANQKGRGPRGRQAAFSSGKKLSTPRTTAKPTSGESPSPSEVRQGVREGSSPTANQVLGHGKKAERRDRSRMSEDELWADLRQGARNVAGVTWQVDVCVYLLVAAHVGHLGIASVTPEGYEDADCTTTGSEGRLFVQMKETAGGAGRMAAADIAAALYHAEESARGARIALITDADIGSGLAPTGWDTTLDEQAEPMPSADSGTGVAAVAQALVNRGLSSQAAESVVSRAHIVRMPWQIRDHTEGLLVNHTSKHPTVVGIAVSRLTELMAAASANQRSTTPETAVTFTVSDVSAALSQAQDSVDQSGLLDAERRGICAPADFLTGADIGPATFYAGVDGRPGHITAGLDIVRPAEMALCAAGLSSRRSVLIVGPSGSGKSVLLWRAARSAIPGARVLHVHRVRSSGDADALGRYVRLLRPSSQLPVLVVIDDLGRPRCQAWPEAALRLRDLQHVYLLGAARSEDFHPRLVIGATQIVEPQLDRQTALAIARELAGAGIPQSMQVQEAFARASGLLMEFLALLTTGQRMEEIIEAQAAELAAPDRLLQRELARLITAAHSAGLSVQADRLPLAVDLGRTGLVGELGDALAVLDKEHVIVSDEGTWRGLHELRSKLLTTFLHKTPPPTIGATWVRLVPVLQPSEVGWLLRRVAEMVPSELERVAAAAASVLIDGGTNAARSAELLEGAERADNAAYAAVFLESAKTGLPENVSLLLVAPMLYAMRNQGMSFDGMGEQFAPALSRMTSLAAQLPRRSDYGIASRTVLAGASKSDLYRLLRDAPAADIVRFLEAADEGVKLPENLVIALFRAVPEPANVRDAGLWSRLITECFQRLGDARATEVLGSIEDRARAVCRADPAALTLRVDEGRGILTAHRLLPLEPSEGPKEAWDIPDASLGKDIINNDTVAFARLLAAACPEIAIVEVVTLTASGARYRIRDLEPGYKRMPRSSFPPRRSVRQSVGFQAAIRRATASETWTALVSEQADIAEELAWLVGSAAQFFNSVRNRSRRNEWSSRLEGVSIRLAAVGSRPVILGVDTTTSQAATDDRERAADPVTRALSAVTEALQNALGRRLLANSSEPLLDSSAYAGLTMSLRAAGRQLTEARMHANPVLSGGRTVIPDDLVEAVDNLAALTAVLHVDPKRARLLVLADLDGSSERVRQKGAEEAHLHRRAILEDALVNLSGVHVQRVADPDPPDWGVDNSGWLVTTPIEMWEGTLSALDVLSDDDRFEFGSHVVVVATVDGGDGSESLSHKPRPAQAPGSRAWLAVRLSSKQTDPPLPLTPDDLARWASAGGLAAGAGALRSEVQALLSALAERSWVAARVRMREFPLLEEPRALPALGDLEGLVAHAAEGLAEEDVDAITSAVELLVAHVRSEEAGTTSVAFAGLVLDLLNSEFPDGSADLAGALATVSLYANAG